MQGKVGAAWALHWISKERAAASRQFSKAWLSKDLTGLGLSFNRNISRTLQLV